MTWSQTHLENIVPLVCVLSSASFTEFSSLKLAVWSAGEIIIAPLNSESLAPSQPLLLDPSKHLEYHQQEEATN